MNCGVYEIDFGKDGKYIGQSQNIEERINSHICSSSNRNVKKLFTKHKKQRTKVKTSVPVVIENSDDFTSDQLIQLLRTHEHIVIKNNESNNEKLLNSMKTRWNDLDLDFDFDDIFGMDIMFCDYVEESKFNGRLAHEWADACMGWFNKCMEMENELMELQEFVRIFSERFKLDIKQDFVEIPSLLKKED